MSQIRMVKLLCTGPLTREMVQRYSSFSGMEQTPMLVTMAIELLSIYLSSQAAYIVQSIYYRQVLRLTIRIWLVNNQFMLHARLREIWLL